MILNPYFCYEQTSDGSYALVNKREGLAVMRTSCPSILFDRSTGTLYRHGDFNRVHRLALDMRKKFCQVGTPDMAAELVFLASRTFNLFELNACILIPMYCKVYHDHISTQ